MFNLFKKQFIDESAEEQKEDLTVLQQLATTNDDFIKSALAGESCDELKNTTGDFGRVATNPIPVNGPLGEIKYLNRIRSPDGCGFIFHRLGSTQQFGISGNIDIFEVVSIDGKTWDILYLHFYHPRRSTKHPSNYHFTEFDKIYSKLPIGYGTTHLDVDFPFGIGKFIEQSNVLGMGKAFAKQFEKNITDKSKFVRPEKHIRNIALAMQLIEHSKDK